MSDLVLEVQPRELTGRKVRQIRAQGLVPVVVYGKKQAPENYQVASRSLERTLQGGGTSQLVTLEVGGRAGQNVLVREVQRHPVSHKLLHADFYAVDMTEKQQVSVPVIGVGEPEALVAGLMVLQAFDQVEIEALPADIPASIEVDVSALDLDRSITIADLPDITGVSYLTDPDEALFTMLAMRIEEEEEDELEEDLLEGAEPEVLTGSKQDEEDEDEG